MARTKVAEKKEKKMNVYNPIKHPLRGSLMIAVVLTYRNGQFQEKLQSSRPIIVYNNDVGTGNMTLALLINQ